jgi:hypothetical protein
MDIKFFIDIEERIWKVTKEGSNFRVEGPKRPGELLYVIARSCARKLGVTKTSDGSPLEHVNEHIRIWNAIWGMGHLVYSTETPEPDSFAWECAYVKTVKARNDLSIFPQNTWRLDRCDYQNCNFGHHILDGKQEYWENCTRCEKVPGVEPGWPEIGDRDIIPMPCHRCKGLGKVYKPPN